MRPLYRHLAIGVLAGALTACSDDGTSTATPDDDLPGGVPVGETDADGTPTTDGPFDTPTDGTPPTTGAPTDGTPPTTGTPTDGTPPTTGTPTDGTPPVTGTPTDGTPPIAGTPTGGDDVGPGSDAGIGTITAARPGLATDPTGVEVTLTDDERNSCEDREISIYARTLSEVCSIEVNGGSRTDFGRGDDAPSAPTGLTALLVADDWVQIDWIPSSDNGAVTAYEIYRDGQLVGTVQDPDTVPADQPQPRVQAQRYWRTTTYIDCDYTRFACETRPTPGTSHVYTVVALDGAGNRSPASAPATFTMNTIQQGAAAPDPASEGYELVFGDDFDTGELDGEKWVTSLSYDQFREDGTVINGEQQYFVDTRGDNFGFPFNPFQFENGTLKLTADRTENAVPADRLDEVRGQPFVSGVISSRSKFEGLRYGYAEIRAKVPAGDGLLATFFLFQPSANQYEIDILEYLGRIPNGATQNYHYRDGFRFSDNGFQGVPHVSPTMEFDGDVDLSEDFHTYSVAWEPGEVVYYIDGAEVRRLTGPRVADVSMDLVAQFVIGSPDFAGDPSGVDFPVSYDIDYIRAWQQQ